MSVTVKKRAWASVCGIISHSVFIYLNCATNTNYAAYNSRCTAVTLRQRGNYYSCTCSNSDTNDNYNSNYCTSSSSTTTLPGASVCQDQLGLPNAHDLGIRSCDKSTIEPTPAIFQADGFGRIETKRCLLYTSPSPRD